MHEHSHYFQAAKLNPLLLGLFLTSDHFSLSCELPQQLALLAPYNKEGKRLSISSCVFKGTIAYLTQEGIFAKGQEKTTEKVLSGMLAVSRVKNPRGLNQGLCQAPVTPSH